MPRKSNKTSYVMNLITNGEEEQGQEGQALQNEQGEQASQNGGLNAQSVQPSAQSTPTAQTSVPGASPEAEIKKVVVVDEDQESERLSEEIKGQLELQLEAELKEQADAAEAEAAKATEEIGEAAKPQSSEPATAQTEPAAEQEPETAARKPMETVGEAAEAGHTAPADTAAMKTEIVEPMMDTEMNTVPETENINTAEKPSAAPEDADMAAEPAAMAENMDAAMETAAATENTTTQPTQPFQSGYRMVNVMETLVARVDLDKYIEEYGVCPCHRCRADVHALILTSLPSKYVVMDESAISPMLNFYESRRKTDIFTATLKACLEVKEHPRHDGAAEK